MHNQSWPGRNDRGQVTILFAIVILAIVVMGVALAVIGDAMIHRATARTAADAVALASVAEPAAIADVVANYRNDGASVELRSDHAWVGSGPSQAAAWAEVTADDVASAPVLRAIVARVEQLRSIRFTTVRWHQQAFDMYGPDAAVMRSMAAEFGLCELATSTGSRFQRC